MNVSRGSASACCSILLFLSAFSVFGPDTSALGKEKDKKKEAAPYALLMGTCFNQDGFSLPGAKVVIESVSQTGIKPKKQKWEMVSSPRGEFAARLPAGRNTFKVSASKAGFRPVTKDIFFEGDERQDIILTLETEAGSK
jgi:hypothetical protein